MIDLIKTIAPKTDQLNADGLVGGAKTITIRDIKVSDKPEQPVWIYFEGDDNKPYKPSLGMRRVLIQLWGEDGSLYIGRKITLYRDEDVTFGNAEVGGIRISHASHITEPKRVLVTVSRSKRKPITILPIFKKPLTNMVGAKKAIQDGKMTIEKLQADYEITQEQLTQLQDEKTN